jgi:hypothetical protein
MVGRRSVCETVDPIIGLKELQMDLWRGVSGGPQNTCALSFLRVHAGKKEGRLPGKPVFL